MTNTPVRAAAEGLPKEMNTNVSRRGLLLGVAAASTAAAVPSAVADAGAAENPELVRLDGEFRSAHEAFLAADESKQAARGRYDAIRPPVPYLLVCKRQFGRGLCERETDCEGKTVWLDDNRPPRWIYSSREIERMHGEYFDTTNQRNKKHGARMKKLHAAAARYEKAVEAARDASGIVAALEARYWTVDAMRRLFYSIVGQEVLTFAGVMIKANALACYASAGPEEAYYAKGAMGGRLADDVLTVCGGLS